MQLMFMSLYAFKLFQVHLREVKKEEKKFWVKKIEKIYKMENFMQLANTARFVFF